MSPTHQFLQVSAFFRQIAALVELWNCKDGEHNPNMVLRRSSCFQFRIWGKNVRGKKILLHATLYFYPIISHMPSWSPIPLPLVGLVLKVRDFCDSNSDTLFGAGRGRFFTKRSAPTVEFLQLARSTTPAPRYRSISWKRAETSWSHVTLVDLKCSRSSSRIWTHSRKPI